MQKGIAAQIDHVQLGDFMEIGDLVGESSYLGKEVTVAQSKTFVDWMTDLELGQICARMQDELENEMGEEEAIIIISSRADRPGQYAHIRECIALWRKEQSGGRRK